MSYTTYILENQSTSEIFYTCPACAKLAVGRNASAVAYPVGNNFPCELHYESVCLDVPTALQGSDTLPESDPDFPGHSTKV